MKQHTILDEALRKIYDHPDLCSGWRARIQEAVPTFKVDGGWEDITKKMKMDKRLDGGVNMSGQYPGGGFPGDCLVPFFLEEGMNWGKDMLWFKVEDGKLYRRLER